MKSEYNAYSYYSLWCRLVLHNMHCIAWQMCIHFNILILPSYCEFWIYWVVENSKFTISHRYKFDIICRFIVCIYTVFLIHLSLFTAIVNKTSDSQFMHKRIKDRQLQLCIVIYIYTYVYMYIHIVSNYINA